MTGHEAAEAIRARASVIIVKHHSTVKLGAEVRIMATGEGYAMVRRKGCMPFVVGLNQLEAKVNEGGES